ncbi:diacylglycerol kinase family protein [Bacillus sp. FJAT-49736]|uniref:diacylglycerol kinase family protein n=1 Tax=Bacillus sp. FJAT-49736 TaxID=2833582 RepID=UPI001BC975B6|nr:diacylglycerol kinase family protein [Bacillus sp. FJAT-49736]MBS4173573.1 diacylglycerol kinase family protein [Bacillus sp. FJAT-49736]
MIMDLKDKDKRIFPPLSKSFSYAVQGIIHGLSKERNFKIHIIAAILAICTSFILKISIVEWLFIIVSIFSVFTLELVNSAIERVVDLVTVEQHPLAKQAKDLAAGAVFVCAIMSVIIACVIFLPKLAHLFSLYI